MRSQDSPIPLSREDSGKIILQGITKSFGPTRVLRKVDIRIQVGDFLTIVGPSGCGKSTLLRIIAGLEPQDEGSVSIDGVVVDALPPKKRDVAMVFQSYALYPHLTVFDNMAVPLRMRQLSMIQRLPFMGPLIPGTREVETRIFQQVNEVAKTLRIEELLIRKPNQLSGGQKQRAALGRAMVRSPRVFLMDEPLSNLDAKLRVTMRSEIVQLHRRMKSTFIYVTHDQAEAMTMSDQVAVMMDGEILQMDSPWNIYQVPADIRVAKFIGSPQINILPGSVAKDGAVMVLEKKIPLRCRSSTGSEIYVGIRPSAFYVAAPGKKPLLKGIVRHIENLGSDLFLHSEIEGLDDLLVVRAQPSVIHDCRIDTPIQFFPIYDEVMIFNTQGKRLEPSEAGNNLR